MKHLIENYGNQTGHHCGSTAMRNLYRHYCGLELSEAMVIGLGSGLDFLYIRQELEKPSVMIFGRGLTLELDSASALGIDYREVPQPDNDAAWSAVRQEVLEGRPTMLSGDALYLDYRDFKVHFAAHRFVLVGFDDEKELAFIADRIDEEIQPCSYGALRKSRNPPEFISTYNLWGKFHGTKATKTLEEAVELALVRVVDRMVGRDTSRLQLMQMLAGGRPFEAKAGLSALHAFRDDLPSFTELDDLAFVSAYLSATIEKFGTGGGNFRNLMADFLDEARGLLPERVDEKAVDLARRSAAAWSELGGHFDAIHKSELENPGPRLEACQKCLSQIIECETQLFERLDS